MRHTHVSYTRASDMVSTLCIAVFVVVHVAATQVARAIISGRARGHSCVGMKIDFTASLISVTISKMKKEMKKAVDERKKRIEQARAETCKIPEIYVYWLRTRQTLRDTHAKHAWKTRTDYCAWRNPPVEYTRSKERNPAGPYLALHAIPSSRSVSSSSRRKRKEVRNLSESSWSTALIDALHVRDCNCRGRLLQFGASLAPVTCHEGAQLIPGCGATGGE